MTATPAALNDDELYLALHGFEVTAVFPSGRVFLVRDGKVCQCKSIGEAVRLVRAARRGK